jgi:alpha-tubulin suppressor-like RCC1 family protein
VNGTATLGQPELILDEAYTYPLASIAIFAFEPEEQEVQTLWQDPEAETDPITEAGQRIAGVRDFRTGDLVAFQEYDAGPLWLGVNQGLNLTNFKYLNIQFSEDFEGVLIVASSIGTYAIEIRTPSANIYNLYDNNIDESISFNAFLFYPDQSFETVVDSEIERLITRGALAKGFTNQTSFFRAWRYRDDIVGFGFVNFINGENFTEAWFECLNLERFTNVNFQEGTNFTSAWARCFKLSSFSQVQFPSGVDFKSSWSRCFDLQEFSQIQFPVGVNFSEAWFQCTGLQSFSQFQFPMGTDFSAAWALCTNLTEFSQVQFTSGSDFRYAWDTCANLTDFSQVQFPLGTRFDGAWYKCTGLTEFPQIEFPAGTDFGDPFEFGAWEDCTNLVSFPLIQFPSGVKFTKAWKNCSNLEEFPQIQFPIGERFRESWRFCSKLNSFPQIHFPAGMDFNSAWRDCGGLENFPQIQFPMGTDFSASWDNCVNLPFFPQIQFPSGTTFFAAWRNCSNMNSFPQIQFPVGTNFGEAWRGCSGLQSFPQILVPSGTSFSTAWFNCTGLQSFPPLEFPAGTSFSSAWSGCSGLQSFPPLEFPAGTNFGSAWRGCSGLQEFPQIEFPLGTNFVEAWRVCTSMTNFSGFNFSATGLSSGTVGNFSNGFRDAWRDCVSLANVPAGIFDNCLSKNFQGAFINCALTQQSVDNILISLDNAGQSNGRIDITGGLSQAPSAVGQAARANLVNKGWTVNVNLQIGSLAGDVLAGAGSTFNVIGDDSALWEWSSKQIEPFAGPDALTASRTWAMVSPIHRVFVDSIEVAHGKVLAIDSTNSSLWFFSTDPSVDPVQIDGSQWNSVSLNYAIKSDGSLWSWDASTEILTFFDNSRSWGKLSSSYNHSLAIASDGTLWSWGANSQGQLGLGDLIERQSPTLVSDQTWQQISTIGSSSFAIKNDGSLWSWGNNTWAQLGFQSSWSQGGSIELNERLLVPTEPMPGTSWINVSAGSSSLSAHTLAIKDDGSLWSWGRGLYGQLGRSGGAFPPAIANDSITWTNIYAGEFSSFAIDAEGSVWSCGLNDNFQLGHGDLLNRTSFVKLRQLSATSVLSTRHRSTVNNNIGGIVISLGADGKVQRWGKTPDARNYKISDESWKSIATGDGYALGIKSNRSLWSWGINQNGAMGIGSDGLTGTLTQRRKWWFQNVDESEWLSVSANYDHSLGIKSDGTLWSWGANYYGQLGLNDTTDRFEPTLVDSSKWRMISVGTYHSIGIKTDGTLWAWGGNYQGQLGLSSSITEARVPTRIGTSLYVFVSCGNYHTLAIRSDGRLLAWGANSEGQIGNNTQTNRFTPLLIGSSLWNEVSATANSSYGIQSNGSLWSWGDNLSGQLGVGDTTDRLVPTSTASGNDWFKLMQGSANYTAFFAAKNDGSLWGWGARIDQGFNGATLPASNILVPTQVDPPFFIKNNS